MSLAIQNYYDLCYKQYDILDARRYTFQPNITSVAVVDSPHPQASTQQHYPAALHVTLPIGP